MKLILHTAMFLLILVAGLVLGLLLTSPDGILPSSYRELETTYGGTELSGLAPDFRLTDQNWVSVALSDFRGKVVVLAFVDSRCQDVCPLTALHLRHAYESSKRSGVDVSRVVFLGVNVNVEANRPEDMANFTRKHGLDEISTWYFLTGRGEELEPVWKAYSIVVLPRDGGEILHTPWMFVIDQAGRKRWYISASGEPAWRGPESSELLSKRIRRLLKAME